MKLRYLLATCFVAQLCDAHSKTTFIPRSIATDQVFELALTNFNVHKNCAQPEFDIKPFFQTTVGHNLTKFFLMNNQCSLSLSENGTGNVDSLWLRLISAPGTFYQSTITMKPQRRTYGAVFTFYSYLSCLCECLWFGVNTAVVHAQHKLGFVECGSKNPGTLTGFQNAYQAFTNPAWCAGKFYCGALNDTRLDDIQAKFGYDAWRNDEEWIAPYILLTIPTGKKIRSGHIFEPIVGSRHASFGVGINADIELCACDDQSLDLMIDANYRYVFAANECRVFDLKNSDWSRFMQVVTPQAPANAVPGINYFTQNVKVTPGSTAQLWAALHGRSCAWHAEVGYNLWWRATEKIKFDCCNTLCDVGIFYYRALCSQDTASTATICEGVLPPNPVTPDASFISLTLNDLDVCSAKNDSVLTNKVYGSVAREWECSRRSYIVGLNVSYEFFTGFKAANQVAVWLDLAVLY